MFDIYNFNGFDGRTNGKIEAIKRTLYSLYYNDVANYQNSHDLHEKEG